MRFLIVSSLAFGIGAFFMRPVGGVTRAVATLAVVASFVVGALFLNAAAQTGAVSTTYLVGLGLEAVITIAIGTVLLGEHLNGREWSAIGLIVAGLAVLKL
jgi:multidrug transporter EmrE-like cation transporter